MENSVLCYASEFQHPVCSNSTIISPKVIARYIFKYYVIRGSFRPFIIDHEGKGTYEDIDHIMNLFLKYTGNTSRAFETLNCTITKCIVLLLQFKNNREPEKVHYHQICLNSPAFLSA